MRRADLEPAALRSLGALHLAAATSLAGDLGRFYRYDTRLCDAAARPGLDARQPA